MSLRLLVKELASALPLLHGVSERSMQNQKVNRKVPFFDFPTLFTEHEAEYVQIFREVASRGSFILQRDIAEFENNIKSFLNVKHAITVSDCTNAILLGLRALGIGGGDEVILASHSFVAAAQSIHYTGATPIPVEIASDRLVEPKAVEQAITSKTKAIMPVHVNGRICNIEALINIAQHHNLLIVEDAAQALGATFQGKYAGTFGSFGTFSFYPSKVLGCLGDGGILVTNDDDLARRVLLMRNHGADPDQDKKIVAWGTNSRLDNIQAAILNYKLGHFAEDIARRRAIARKYHQAFCDIKDLGLPPAPDRDPDYFDVYQNYEIESGRRDELRSFLAERGIGTIIQWGGIPLHQMTHLGFNQHLPITDRFFERCFLLPMNHMLSDDDTDYICETVQDFYS
ncbi:MAG: DegT/DnrJ/EryC1/StrS family aminotransferase [Coleofasciculus sp. G1-WW12-02]|uniref:DegT/DnrJ/EryC1/StrS family aminotransferase n=1 Tax=Coleofasciculus sp. G1-WW12-02 TaxID=3068483 RepID=UPI0032FC0863